MMNMMMYSATPSMMLLQCIACLAMLVGAFLLASWAAKTLTPGQTIGWAVGLLLGGSALCVLATGPVAFGNDAAGCPMMKDGKCRMMDDHMDHGSHGMDSMHGDDHMAMSMNEMSAMLEGKKGDAFDEAFLRMMIPHHQGAIDMVKDVESSAKHEELKQLARDIATAQQREIDMMNGWLEAWGYND